MYLLFILQKSSKPTVKMWLKALVMVISVLLVTQSHCKVNEKKRKHHTKRESGKAKWKKHELKVTILYFN